MHSTPPGANARLRHETSPGRPPLRSKRATPQSRRRETELELKRPFLFLRVTISVLVVLIAAGLFVWLRLSSPLELDAPPPVIAPNAPDSLAPIPLSIVDAPVTYDLRTAIDSLEAAVPLTYGDIETRIPVGSNTRANFSYAVSRSPFRVKVEGSTISISADVEYQGRVWYKPIIGPELSASCGTGDGPRPRVRATLSSTAELTSRWQLRTKTRLVRLEPYSDEPRDRCRLTILRIDVTDRVIEGTRGMLEKHLEEFDQAAERWPVRPRFERIWQQLQKPIRFTNDVYMTINPVGAQLGPVSSDGKTVVAQLRLLASPRIVTGPGPGSAGPMTTIPPLQSADSVGNGARVAIDAQFTYPVANTLLRKALVGKSLVQAGHRVRIRDVELSGVGGGRVALGVLLAGGVRGRAYFVGTPAFDPKSHQLYVPDLDYDVGTAQSFVRGLGWLNGVDIRDFLRERARLPDSTALGKLSELAERGINRQLAPGVELKGTIQHTEVTSVRATRQEIRIRALGEAMLRLEINKPPPLPKIPDSPES